jgi:hypothetical protein
LFWLVKENVVSLRTWEERERELNGY